MMGYEHTGLGQIISQIDADQSRLALYHLLSVIEMIDRAELRARIERLDKTDTAEWVIAELLNQACIILDALKHATPPDMPAASLDDKPD